MSSSAGIGGAFGLLLSEFPSVAAIYGDLKLYVNQALDREVAAEPGDMEGAMELLQIRDRLIGAFAEDGIPGAGVSRVALDRLRGRSLGSVRNPRRRVDSRLRRVYEPLGLSADG